MKEKFVYEVVCKVEMWRWKCGAKTLFATHYHELTKLEDKIDGVKNYSIAVKEKGEDSMYNYKLAEMTHELDKINVNELTSIDAMNILVKLKDAAS